jgi:hypothetical protein
MKTFVCLAVLSLTQLCAQAQEIFGGPTEGGGPGGAPATNYPCWRYPIRIINYKKIDLHPQFEWWQENFGAYQSAFAAAQPSQKPPDLSSLTPPPLPGWHRIKEGHYISDVAYGWLCEAVIEDYPSHVVTNRIIIRTPPIADKAKWEDLVNRYYELKDEAGDASPAANPAAKHTHHKSLNAASGAAYQQAGAQNAYGATNSSATHASAHHHAAKSTPDDILAALEKFPQGTNYTVDLFALKLGYLQDGTHRQVYDLGQMYTH